VSPVVTRLEPERPRSRRTIVELDGERVRLMPALLVSRLGLEAGDDVDPAQLAEQASRVEPGLARERALYLLSYRERSCGELLAKLADDGYDASLAADLVADLEDRGLVDDRRYTEALVRTLTARSYGRSRIARELARHRVDPGIIEAALDAALPVDDEYQRALDVARRATRGRTLDLRRLAGRLARKGFRSGVALGAAREALAEQGAEGTDTEEVFEAD
jgi:regulatory protein